MAARERLELLQYSVLRFAVRVHRASRSPGSLGCHSILALNSCSNLDGNPVLIFAEYRTALTPHDPGFGRLRWLAQDAAPSWNSPVSPPNHCSQTRPSFTPHTS